MPQAKGILPRREDREVLYKNPRTCGYFIAVKLDPAIDRPRAQAWLEQVSSLVDELVARLPPADGEAKGEKVAAVAVGLAPSFFYRGAAARFTPPTEVPAWFAPDVPRPNAAPPLSDVQLIDADVLFYVASVFEARVNAFLSKLAEMSPDVQKVSLDRGYQREDETEQFGYKDGIRNVRPRDRRPEFVFVHRDDGELDEPSWADGGSYMVFLKILQRPDQFAALPSDAARDETIGRTKDGTRLDLLGQGLAPGDEPADVPTGLPPTAHVRKAGPRGDHDDTQIFRRGLPFMETTPEGQLRVGLHFCSFQASLAQFDVVFNDWIMSRQFPPQESGAEPGVDALLDPSRQLAEIEKVGFFFVPPYDERGLAAAVFPLERARRRPTTGRLVVHKRVVDPNDLVIDFLVNAHRKVGIREVVADLSARAAEADWMIDIPLMNLLAPRETVPLGKRAMLVRTDWTRRSRIRDGSYLKDVWAIKRHLGDEMTPRNRWLMSSQARDVDLDTRKTTSLLLIVYGTEEIALSVAHARAHLIVAMWCLLSEPRSVYDSNPLWPTVGGFTPAAHTEFGIQRKLYEPQFGFSRARKHGNYITEHAQYNLTRSAAYLNAPRGPREGAPRQPMRPSAAERGPLTLSGRAHPE